MWPWKTQAAFLSEALAKAEARAEAAEVALALERRERMADVRHVVSQFLRREKTYPLPPTAEEKAEAQSAAEQAKQEPSPLTDVQLAQRDAYRMSRPEGVTQEEADEVFMQMMNAGQLD